MYKSKKGITLIALVVTIIVLLILAGISIMMLTGNNGITTRAQSAKVETETSSSKEKIKLAYNAALADGQGKITEELLEKELENEFGTRNDKYSLISSKDGKDWVITVYETGTKEIIAKPTNLQTEPINPEEEYGYKDKAGVIDANDLIEGDIINYYYSSAEDPISCAVLFNDKSHGLQVVTLNSIRDIFLGKDLENADPKAEEAFENGNPEGYDESINDDSARYQYKKNTMVI